MAKEQLKRMTKPVWEPVVRRLDARMSTILARLDGIEREQVRTREATEELRGALSEVLAGGEFASIGASLASLREDVWHSKVVPIGDRLLVGSRHLGMVFLVEADDRLIGPRFIVDGEYEPETSAFMLQTVTPTSVCVDVGANFGYYTCLMSRLAWEGRTISFEPDPNVHALLRENVYINWCERAAEPTNAAVGDTVGELTLFRRVGRSGNTSIIESTQHELDAWAEEASEAFTVACTTLDALAERLERVDLVKIDVEGAESLVVAGMGELVRKHRPTIVMEWSPWQTQRAGFDVQQLAADLEALDLVPHTLGPGGTTTAITYDELVELTYQNIVLTPR